MQNTQAALVQHPIKLACILIFVLVFYFWGITDLAAESLWVEISIVLLFPLFCAFLGLIKIEPGNGRVFSLFMIESFFNLLVVLTKLAIIQEWTTFNHVLTYGFVLFFIVQTLGFLAYSFKLKHYLSAFNSALFFILIMLWFFDSPKINVIDNQGRFLFWGENAPTWIITYYLVWLINVVFIDTIRLPNARQAIVSIVSAVFAAFSGEFFHARILTASHLFLLDVIFHYGDHRTRQSIGVMMPATYAFFNQHIKPWLPWAVSSILVGIFIVSLILR